MPRLLLVDEQALVRAGIKRLLQDEADTEVVAESSGSQECIEKLRAYEPDMVIMDIGAEDLGVFDVVRRMLAIDSNVKLIVLTTTLDASFPTRILKLGASACLSKRCSANDLYSAIKAVKAGQRYVSTKVAQQMLQGKNKHWCNSPFLKLSNRELQIMYMFTRAMDVHDISARLYLSPKTISTYRYRIFAKLGVRGDVELTHLAMRYGMLEGQYILPVAHQEAS
jgi:two-component system invasion response regulator UvrY